MYTLNKDLADFQCFTNAEYHCFSPDIGCFQNIRCLPRLSSSFL